MIAMQFVQIGLEEDLATILQGSDESVEDVAKELMVLELYRRGTLSSGRAAELLGMPRVAFIKHASRIGIPYFDMSDEEWEAERQLLEAL